MAKTTITGKFATGSDAATVHQISHARRQWLDREISKAIADVVPFTPVRTKSPTHGKKSAGGPKSSSPKITADAAALRAKKK